jgi:hypothetical protein
MTRCIVRAELDQARRHPDSDLEVAMDLAGTKQRTVYRDTGLYRHVGDQKLGFSETACSSEEVDDARVLLLPCSRKEPVCSHQVEVL